MENFIQIKNISKTKKREMNSKERTQTFSIRTSKETETKKILETVYQALIEKGYDPLDQLVGYILSEDPTYITNYNNARSLIRRIDRDELMRILIRSYLNIR